ncbi:prothymosin alpha-like [Phyllostomus discolor]|uniref:Prothymosin alpha n=1 Tax=Phyllostomus discolor TaxID=89673 RepID=A0A7E6D1J5_9CHIR|nr:prothymosin alpha-like [Phyllostomus discolor]
MPISGSLYQAEISTSGPPPSKRAASLVLPKPQFLGDKRTCGSLKLRPASRVPALSDMALDASSEITTKDLKEKKEIVEELENGRDAPANGNANKENGEQEADKEVDGKKEEGGAEEEEGDNEEEDGDEYEETEAATGKQAAEDDKDDDVDTKKQKTDEDD